MTALDFMMGCIGVGVIFVCGAWSFKILSDIKRIRSSMREPVKHNGEPLDPMGKRLQEFRDAQFGISMTPKSKIPAHQLWPITKEKSALNDRQKNDKDGKK